ncbi:MAG TPA: Asp-tRNA(Asn)/Glu-tRNA(Gln) amidotransferase subunit GatC, partial [Candidatus Angelobacter sp.]|nr:Asp-tRNA(Asn)/Glu-tRNA(Gln) amidotransferase subunit GatC [Candidatus Angelobacter sp.]
MKVTDKDVAYVADLANLELTDQERQRMIKDLNSILDYIDRLNELDTTNVPPMAQISGTVDSSGTAHDQAINLLRKDELIPCLPHAEAMQNAP